MESTYEILTENCMEECKDVNKTPNDTAFEFCYTLISQLMIVLYQDHHIYPSCLARLDYECKGIYHCICELDIVLSTLEMSPQKLTIVYSVILCRMS